MPVLGVGLVWSGRYVARQWTPETSRIFRVCVAIIWGTNLVALGVGESVALRALRGEMPDDRWGWICEQAVLFGTTILFIGPAIELMVRANAESLGKMFTLYPFMRVRTRRLRRKMLKYMVHGLRALEGLRLSWFSGKRRSRSTRMI